MITVDLTWTADHPGPVSGEADYWVDLLTQECIPQSRIYADLGRDARATGSLASRVLGNVSGSSSEARLTMGVSEATGCLD